MFKNPQKQTLSPDLFMFSSFHICCKEIFGKAFPPHFLGSAGHDVIICSLMIADLWWLWFQGYFRHLKAECLWLTILSDTALGCSTVLKKRRRLKREGCFQVLSAWSSREASWYPHQCLQFLSHLCHWLAAIAQACHFSQDWPHFAVLYRLYIGLYPWQNRS